MVTDWIGERFSSTTLPRIVMFWAKTDIAKLEITNSIVKNFPNLPVILIRLILKIPQRCVFSTKLPNYLDSFQII